VADQDQKKHAASAQKLDRLRKDGKVPDSPDLIASVSLIILVFGLLASASWQSDALFGIFANFLPYAGKSDEIWGALTPVLVTAALSFFLPVIGVFGISVSIKGWAPRLENLGFKWDRINPLKNAPQKFGSKGLIAFTVSFGKMIAVSCLGAVLTFLFLDSLQIARELEGHIWLALGDLKRLLLVCALIFVLFGGIDFVIKRTTFLNENKMTDQEVKDEHKDNEGTPEVKQKRRQRAYEIASSRMMQDVAEADVLIVNPVHIAVALRWSREKGTAPICVAKGQDLIAQNLKSIAIENAVPVRQDIPTARAIHAVCDIGAEIPPDLYAAVAIAIRFADGVREQARKSPFGGAA
jgi:flagellar biosynthetic protein FlhB